MAEYGLGCCLEQQYAMADTLTDLDLSSLIPGLDNVASELVNQQRDSLTQRKDLAQKTKDFKKLDDAGKLTEIKSLLKGNAGSLARLSTYTDCTQLTRVSSMSSPINPRPCRPLSSRSTPLCPKHQTHTHFSKPQWTL